MARRKWTAEDIPDQNGKLVVATGAATNLQAAGPRMTGARLRARLTSLANRLAQSAAMGALPILHAATAERVNGCDYIGPTSWGGTRGYPGKVRSSPRSYDVDLARRLWQVSEDLTGVRGWPD